MKKYLIISFVTLLAFVVFGVVATTVKITKQAAESKNQRALDLIDKIGEAVAKVGHADQADINELNSLLAYIPGSAKYNDLKKALKVYDEASKKEAKTDEEKAAKAKYSNPTLDPKA